MTAPALLIPRPEIDVLDKNGKMDRNWYKYLALIGKSVGPSTTSNDDIQLRDILGAISDVPTQQQIGQQFYPQTDAERAAGVGPANYAYPAGNVLRYGADPAGVIDCSAITAIAASCNSLVLFPPGAWLINSTPTIPAGVSLQTLPHATFTGGGAGALGFSTSPTQVYANLVSMPEASVTDIASNNMVRLANYSGGSGGAGAAVANALRIQTNVGSGAGNNEWGLLCVLNNNTSTSSTGQNNAAYFQAIKGNFIGIPAGMTWGVTIESRDKSGLSDPTTGHIGAELDLFADGTDVNGQRVMLDLVGGPGVSIGPSITYGIRIGPVNGNVLNANWSNGIYLYGDMQFGIRIVTSTGAAVGVDTSGATLTNAALRIGSTQFIGLDASDGHRLGYSIANSGLAYTVGGVVKSVLNDAGGLFLNAGVMNIPGTANSTGTTAAVLTANKPGATTAIGAWVSVLLNGIQYWVPAWPD